MQRRLEASNQWYAVHLAFTLHKLQGDNQKFWLQRKRTVLHSLETVVWHWSSSIFKYQSLKRFLLRYAPTNLLCMIMVCNFMPMSCYHLRQLQQVVVNGNMTFKDGNRDNMHAREHLLYLYFSLYNTHTHICTPGHCTIEYKQQNTFSPSKSDT